MENRKAEVGSVTTCNCVKNISRDRRTDTQDSLARVEKCIPHALEAAKQKIQKVPTPF